MNRGSPIGADGRDASRRLHEPLAAKDAGMVMDTSTVRLVIFLGMFLVFAGDYSYLVSTIFGRTADRNITEPIKGPVGPPSELPMVKKDYGKENGKGQSR